MNNSKKAFVLGMAKSGYEAAKLLVSKGYDVVVNDAKVEQNEEQKEELQKIGVTLVLGDHPDELFDNTFEIMVKNPGVPNNHKYVMKANEYGIPVINEVELSYRYFPKGIKIIGVTGTNGKTTTTTMIYEMLKLAGKSVHLMGNIGFPISSFIPILKEGDIAVIEISDHQLVNMSSFKTNISVLTNLSEAHLDFHGSYDAYKQTKMKIFNNHTSNDIAILNISDKDSMQIVDEIKSTKKYFSSDTSFCNVDGSINNDNLCYNGNPIMPIKDVKVKGNHNYENALAAIIAVKEFEVSDEIIREFLSNFNGVEHRIEYVKTLNGREFYNDSKATNIISTQTALSSFSKPTILLMGGLDRGHSFDGLKDYLKNVKAIVAYGETKQRIKDFGESNQVHCQIAETLEDATRIAYSLSNEGDVILLSPACASWDQFKDFEMRGNLFKEYVNKL